MTILDVIKSANKLVIDTGVYIEYFQPREDKIKQFLRDTIFTENSRVKLYGNFVIRSEMFYILCRLIGNEKADNRMEEIGKFITYIEDSNMFKLAGQIKCKFSIALTDCYSIATGIFMECPVLFMKEGELNEAIIENINEDFNSNINILDESIF